MSPLEIISIKIARELDETYAVVELAFYCIFKSSQNITKCGYCDFDLKSFYLRAKIKAQIELKHKKRNDYCCCILVICN